jgi:hypothetical protein
VWRMPSIFAAIILGVIVWKLVISGCDMAATTRQIRCSLGVPASGSTDLPVSQGSTRPSQTESKSFPLRELKVRPTPEESYLVTPLPK